MYEVTLPKLNNNDTSYVLVDWLVADGGEVAEDTPIAVVETSKAAEELVAEKGGILHHCVAVTAEIEIGAVVGRIFATSEDRRQYLAAETGTETGTAPEPGADTGVGGSGSDVVITRSAAEAAAELGVDIADLRTLGRKVLKRRDVEEHAAARSAAPATRDPDNAAARLVTSPEAGTVRLSPAQRAVGQVVTRSHHEVPAGFAVVKVPVDTALRVLGEISARTQVAIGLPELLVKAVAGLRAGFPLCFGGYRDDGTVLLSEGAHVGVTLDLGAGLYIPVIKDAQAKPLVEIADTLMDLRVSALRGSFRERELAGGNITISLNNDPDIVLAGPIIFTGQTCMLCLCSTQEEVYRTGGGDFDVRHYVHLGVTYDHRVVNGREAALLLQALKSALTDEEVLTGLG
jgi:2-oxoglutarate dehydrogenase E2 component (dihydrolipoamide succinyltransferase)